MPLRDDLPLRYVLAVPCGQRDDAELPLVVMIHGRGADANDLADLAPLLDGPGGYRFVFPNAPKPFEAYPGMAFGFTWFDGWPAEQTSLLESRRLLLAFLEAVAARYPTPQGKIVLSGFSQGGVMSVEVGFRTPQPLAGIIVMSGGIFEDDLPDFRARRDQRLLLIHGTDDEVIPLLAAHRARRLLEDHGIEPEYHELPMGHQVSEESMRIVKRFLASVFSDGASVRES